MPSDPEVVARITASPPDVRRFSFTSTACTVTVAVLAPSATIESGAASIVVIPPLAGPGTKLTISSSISGCPSRVPVMVDCCATVVDGKTALYVPSPLYDTGPSKPAVAFSFTTFPPVGIGSPRRSLI